MSAHPHPLTRFSFLMTNCSYGLPSERLFQQVIDLAAAAESTVFDTFWVPDHLVQGPVGDISANTGGLERSRDGDGTRTPIFDAPTVLGALAAATRTIRIGALVTPSTTRHPAIVAKSTTTVDVVSGGRAVLGLGAGWDADEHRRYGFAFPPPRERLDRLEDMVQIARAMFDEEAATYSGKHYSIAEAYNVPRPVSRRIPILLGGSGKRSLRLAATHADACNPFITDLPSLRDAFSIVTAHCERIGRDPAEVSKPTGIVFNSVQGLYSLVEDSFKAGSDGVILIPWQQALSPDDLVSIGDRLKSLFGEQSD
jgi:alkanesulfonate monooxygenase SsuD/methylene tetrahydromethanopterin reductase-like flavin-dependent oxidoreductase (luciferase family)